ncbi:Protein fmp32, mitochondrial [Sporothrix eucalyptigena]|uniref:Protein fmp32, mitochondrial n=1 Tax=Sporothrix eucalyptigena TaxID=1812306 RepID=A0ABP0BDB9_9PEZI
MALQQSLPRFLLPQLSWTAPLASPLRHANAKPMLFGLAATAAFSTCPHSHRRPVPTRKSPVSAITVAAARRAFHASAVRHRDHHFDTLKFVQRLRDDGFTEEQSVAMMKVLNDVIEESIQNLTRTMVLREDAAKATYTQKVDFAKLRSELLSADSTENNTTRAAHERLANDLAKFNSRLRDEVGRTQASVRLDLNLEKGRIREEAVGQELKVKETETRIEQEVAAMRQQLEQVKFQTLQWLMGVCTGFAALLLGAWRLLM